MTRYLGQCYTRIIDVYEVYILFCFVYFVSERKIVSAQKRNVTYSQLIIPTSNKSQK